MTVLLVDAANVVGARPDGWWRDRAGATTRLLARLARLPARAVPGPDGEPLTAADVVVVVEGQAKGATVPTGLRVVLAPGSGDDALVTVAHELVDAGRQVLAVTADRGLRARLPEGLAVAGPGWLRDVLDGMDSAPSG